MPLQPEHINRTEVQSRQNALVTIREQFERMRSVRDITRDMAEGIFRQREAKINEDWAHLIDDSPSVNMPELEAARDRIIGDLNVLKLMIFGNIQALSDKSEAESQQILEKNKEAYRIFLHSLGLISAEDSSPARPERGRRRRRRRRSSRSSRRRTQVDVRRSPGVREADKVPRDKIPTAPLNIDSVIEQRSRLGALIRPIENQRERQGFREDRREINMTFIELARNWRDVDMRFSLKFLNKIQNSDENIAFLMRAIRQPDELRVLVKSLYQILLSTHSRPTDNNIERFFVGLENTIDRNTTISQAYTRLVEGVQWDREMENQSESIETIVARNTLFAIESSINSRRLPEKAQLLTLQRLVRSMESNFLNGGRLTWEGLRNYRMVDETVRMEGEIPLVNPNRKFIIQGNEIKVRNVDVTGQFSISKATSPHSGMEHDFDVPHLLSTLRLVSDTYSSSFEGQTNINFSHFNARIEQNPDALRNEINMTRHRTLLREMGITAQRREEYENKFSETLSDLLDDPSDSKPPQDWVNMIEARQGSAGMEDDAYKFLWVVRTYVRTRAITGGPYTIQQFSEALLNSPDIRVLRENETPNQNFQTARPVTQPIESANMAFEYRNYLTKIPNIKEIFDFIDKNFTNPTAVPPPSNNGNPFTTRADVMVNLFEQVDRESLSSRYVSIIGGAAAFPRYGSEGDNSHAVSINMTKGLTLNVPRMLFSPEIINQYRQLKTSNPLFREFISLAQSNEQMTFVKLAHFVFTPEQTTDHVLTSRRVS